MKLHSSLCFFRFGFDEEMFFDEVAFGVAFDVCFQYASCDSEVVICYLSTRQLKGAQECVMVVCERALVSVCMFFFLCVTGVVRSLHVILHRWLCMD